MFKLEIKNVSKTYSIDKKEKFYALKDINMTLDKPQLIMIYGPSGCGKTTFVNLLALLDKPSNGSIYFNGEDVSKWKETKKNRYRINDIGIVFQNNQLLEEQTGLFNIMLPLLIAGVKEKQAKEKAIELLKSFDIKEGIYLNEVSKMSGGEKQRISILRAVVNNPQIVFADEPTGALDSTNSLVVMDLLQRLSNDKLVIVISHNEDIVSNFGDRVISLKDGEISEDIIRRLTYIKAEKSKKENKRKRKDWKRSILKSNYHRRLKRNVIAILCQSVCITLSLLVCGFLFGKDNSINQQTKKQFDIGNSIISKEVNSSIDGGGIQLIKTIRPTYDDMKKISQYIPDVLFELNVDTLLSSSLKVQSSNLLLENMEYTPIYSFKGNHIDEKLLSLGSIPKDDTIEEVVINNTAFEQIKQINPGFALNSFIEISSEYNHTFYNDSSSSYIKDLFVYEKKVKVVGVVNEFSFMLTPKVYYSYVSFLDYLQEVMVINHSKYIGRDISWFEEITNCSSGDSLSSYSYRLFLKDYNDYEKVNFQYKLLPEYFSITTPSYLKESAMKDIFSAMTVGMEAFLLICILGTILLCGMLSFSSYNEDRRRSAILSCLGADNLEISSIYIDEALTNILLGNVLAFGISLCFEMLINRIITSLSGYQNMICIPFQNVNGIPFLFPLIVLLLAILLSFISTLLPIIFSKRISVNEELKSND